MARLDRVALDASRDADWPAPCTGHPGIRVRALTDGEARQARAAAADVAPIDMYGQSRYLTLMAEHAQRLDELRRIAADLAVTYQDIVIALQDEPTPALIEQAARAKRLAIDARDLMIKERDIGLARAEAALGVDDPAAYAAIQRFHRHLLEPHRQLAARAITAWPSAPFQVSGPESVLAAFEALDVTGFAGTALAHEIVLHLEGRALDGRGKGRSALPSSSRGGGTKAKRSGLAGRRGRAKAARKRG